MLPLDGHDGVTLDEALDEIRGRFGPNAVVARCCSGATTACRCRCFRIDLRNLPPVNVSAESARRFLVARQLLSPARSLEGGRDAVLEVFRRFGSVQYDPIDVAGRTHDLMLHARVADYDPAWTDELYERREIFEAYNKGLSFVYDARVPLVPRTGAVDRRRP